MMLRRREFIAALLGHQVAMTAGCSRRSLPPAGELLRTNFQIGHQIRDRRDLGTPKETESVGVVIVGGGISGLSAAWGLKQAGFDDFVLLELENQPGGTARGGRSGKFAYPWGAHYVPVPMPENHDFLRLLEEMQVVERFEDDGRPVIAEQYLCRDPSERLFYDGQWHEGIYPYEGAGAEDIRQLNEFRAEIDRWVERRDPRGRRMFAIPMATGSDDAEVRRLDQFSMADWMDQHRWTSDRLRWYIDYACRDDYGLSIDRVSAWAGLFYFASRVRAAGEEPQSVITWPEGNGRIANHLGQQASDHVRCSMAAAAISPADDGLSVTAIDTSSGRVVRFDTPKVILAAPQFLAPYLLRKFDTPVDRAGFQYGSWLVANVHLKDRPDESGFPMSWDNVIYQSKSLGYVTSTHQTGLDHGPTVLTWYYPFADVEAKLTREKMLRLTWEDWADLVMTDLRLAHDDIDALVTRIDVMCWGHAMIQPRVGFIWGKARTTASIPIDGLHFAGTDLSGVPLIEEAFYHGMRAAREVVS